jgi:hypothetical protein
MLSHMYVLGHACHCAANRTGSAMSLFHTHLACVRRALAMRTERTCRNCWPCVLLVTRHSRLARRASAQGKHCTGSGAPRWGVRPCRCRTMFAFPGARMTTTHNAPQPHMPLSCKLGTRGHNARGSTCSHMFDALIALRGAPAKPGTGLAWRRCSCWPWLCAHVHTQTNLFLAVGLQRTIAQMPLPYKPGTY